VHGDKIGDADATNGRIGGLGVGFGQWRPQGGKQSKNVESLRRQREKGNRDASRLRPQFVIVIKKYNIDNISKREGRLVEKSQSMVENHRKIQKIILKLK
jgi:hypothetical protein